MAKAKARGEVAPFDGLSRTRRDARAGHVASVKPPIDLLARVELFQGLSKKELREVWDAGKEIDFREGAVIAEQGGAGGRFYLIIEGQAGVAVQGRRPRLLGPGDYFGDVSLIDGAPGRRRSWRRHRCAPSRSRHRTSVGC